MVHDPSHQRDGSKPRALTADEVASYLAKHPDFFAGRGALAAKLVPPSEHRGGGIIDFQHFMVRSLQGDIEKHRGEKRDLIATARSNLHNQTRIHAAILAMLEAESFEQLIGAITTDLVVYLDVDIATLLIEAEGPEIVSMKRGEIRIVEPGQIDTWLGHKDVMLRGDIEGDPDIYGDGAGLVQSEALLRLEISKHAPVGMLAFGSREADLFQDGQGTELIGFLARVVERLIRAWLDLAE